MAQVIKATDDCGVSASSNGESVACTEVMAEYRTLDVGSVIEYVAQTLPQWSPLADGTRILAGSIVTAEEVGDGNLNLVFRLLDKNGCSRAVLKQALPYVRMVGESWPLTVDRNRLEATTLQEHYKYCPKVTERVLFTSIPMATMVVEDLSDCAIWRNELIQKRYHVGVPATLGHYLAIVHFNTSDFARPSAEKKRAVARMVNVALCKITEDLFFTDPYTVDARNDIEPSLRTDVVHKLREDAALKISVARLKHAFQTKTEGHLHGDIHSGSVFVDANRVKVIDAEFGFYGPLGFDVGTVIGSLIINCVALLTLSKMSPTRTRNQAAAADGAEEKTGQAESLSGAKLAKARAATTAAAVMSNPDRLLSGIGECWSAYHDTFLALAKANTIDVSLAAPGYVEVFLATVWTDTVGYSGTEVIRRTVGLAHAADLDSITDKHIRTLAKKSAIEIGCNLIKDAATIATVQELASIVKQQCR